MVIPVLNHWATSVTRYQRKTESRNIFMVKWLFNQPIMWQQHNFRKSFRHRSFSYCSHQSPGCDFSDFDRDMVVGARWPADLKLSLTSVCEVTQNGVGGKCGGFAGRNLYLLFSAVVVAVCCCHYCFCRRNIKWITFFYVSYTKTYLSCQHCSFKFAL